MELLRSFHKQEIAGVSEMCVSVVGHIIFLNAKRSKGHRNRILHIHPVGSKPLTFLISKKS